MRTPTNILVLGGTGFVGRSVCERLVERSAGGGRITVPSRRPQRAKHLAPLPTIDLVAADVNDETQLTRLVAGRDAVINLIAILHGSEAAFTHAHVDLTRKLANACKSQGVGRIVHVSALGAHPDAGSAYLRSKGVGEAALRVGGLDTTLLRPSVIFGEHDRFINLFARLQALAPVVPLAAADARFQPVWVEDVAAAIVAALDRPDSIGRAVECAGPDVYTLRQLVQMAGRWSGHPRPVLALPEALGRLQARVMEWLPGEPLMSGDNLDSMHVASVLTGTQPGLASLGVTPVAMEAVMAPLLQHRQGVARFAPWRMHARRN